FFQTVQNKMHWAAHGHTAAEVVKARSDAGKPNAGLLSWSGSAPRKQDVGIAKNYLEADELDTLNRIVTAYLEFAELQALNRQLMTMADWIAKLDDFLRLGGREVLDHAGKVKHTEALKHAEQQYAAFRREQAALARPVDAAFDASTRALKPLAARRATRKKGD
ncbi:MAG: virulence RhuM family protein, partial [Xanthomonadales bacterium]|nr:virulence RhuM family protein [Xanthomonadales bacterium]